MAQKAAYSGTGLSDFLSRLAERNKGAAEKNGLFASHPETQERINKVKQLAGAKPGKHIQGRSLLSLLSNKSKGWRKSFLIEYWAENAMPWLVGMTYKAVRTDRHKLIHWVNRGEAGELDELYDLERDPYELRNLMRSRASAPLRAKLQKELARLVSAASGL